MQASAASACVRGEGDHAVEAGERVKLSAI